MSKLLVVISSARPGRIADNLLPIVREEMPANTELTVVDLKELNLPFFDNERAPSDPEYTITNDAVQKWATLVRENDGIVFLTPEYNHNLSALQKNAFDSLGKEWEGKPVTFIAYGWYGGAHSLAALNAMATPLKFAAAPSPAELFITKDITTDGSAIEGGEARQKVAAALSSLTETIVQ